LIALFTDFGLTGPYTGQMKAVLQRDAPGTPVVDLFADAPSARPQPAAYLLAAYAAWFPPGTVFLCVVDPGVGGARAPLIIEADRHWYVGPDNGLFEVVLRRAAKARVWHITFKPASLSASFHGRDLFAPVAARLARGRPPPGKPHQPTRFPAGPMTWPKSSMSIITAMPSPDCAPPRCRRTPGSASPVACCRGCADSPRCRAASRCVTRTPTE